MKIFSGLILVVFLSACGTSATNLRSNVAPQQVAEAFSCAEISQKIFQLDKILESASPSETQELFKSTAVSAAKTGVSLSGVLGAAAPLANLGMNFMQGLYSINAKQRQAAIKEAAQEEKFLMLDAYDYKQCVG